MCHPPALAGCCGGERSCAGHMVKPQSGRQLANGRFCGVIVCAPFQIGLKLLAWQPYFGNGIYAAEGKLLPSLVARLLESTVMELSVVSMVMLDADTMVGGKLLKCLFGGDGLDGGIVDLKMDKLQWGVVIHEDGGTPVSLFGE
jgi:hypothetical protein